MNSKVCKAIRKQIKQNFSQLSSTPLYNLTKEEMLTTGRRYNPQTNETEPGKILYLTTECQRFYYKIYKNEYNKRWGRK